MIGVSSKVELNIPVIVQLDRAAVTALEQTADAYLTELKNAEVMTFDTGNLQNESTFVDYTNSSQGVVSIVSSTPYVRRLYFHPEFNFQKTHNRNAMGEWHRPWLKGGPREHFTAKTFATIYKRLSNL